MSHVLWVFALLPLVAPQKVNITLGIISNYCAIRDLTYDGSLALNYKAVYSKNLNLYGLSGFVYFNDIAYLAAANMVNNDPTFAFHVNLKRFSDCGHWYPEAEQFSGNSGGWASSIVVQDIVEKNQDVIAVVADQYSTTAVGPAEALSLNQIPYCSSASSAPTFSDKIKNPYFWRPLPGAGMGEHVFRLLQSWKVGRIALIVQSDDALGASTAADIIRAMKNHGVQVVATVNLPTNLNKFSYLYAKASLEQAQARYIFVCGQGSFSASLLYRMGKLGFWGPKFVWMLYNSPKPYYGDPLQTYGPDYYNYVQGSIVLLPTTVPSTVPYVQTFQNTIKKMGGAYFYYSYGTGASYDCVMMMMLGLNQLLQRNPSWTPQMLATRQLQSHMNYTIFKNVSYNGISAMPATLSDSGDLLVGYTASFYTGNYLNLTSFGQTSQDGSQFIPSTTITPVFAANTTLIPVDGPPPLPVIVDTMDTSNGKVMLALSVSGLVICAAVLVFVGVFRGSRVVKSASPPDLVVVVLGCVSVYVSILFYIGESTDSTCTARIVTLVMGVGAILTSLLVKNLMLVVLFRFKAAMGKAEAARLRMGTLILKFLLIGIEALIAGIWVKQSGVEGVQDVGSSRVVYECQDWVGRGKQISHLSMALYVFNGILLLCIAPIIYGLRLVSWGNMNESSTLTMIAVFWAVFFLLLQAIASTPSDPSSGIKTSICLWVVTTATLGLLFGGKMLEVWFDLQIDFKKLSFNGLMSQVKSRGSSGGSQEKSTMASTISGEEKGQKRNSSAAKKRLLPSLSARDKERLSAVTQTSSVYEKNPGTYRYKKITLGEQKHFLCRHDNTFFGHWHKTIFHIHIIKTRAWVSFQTNEKLFTFYISEGYSPEARGSFVIFTAMPQSARKDKVTMEFENKDKAVEFVKEFNKTISALANEQAY